MTVNTRQLNVRQPINWQYLVTYFQVGPVTFIQALHRRLSTAVIDLGRTLSPLRFISQLGEHNPIGTYDVTNPSFRAQSPEARLIQIKQKTMPGTTFVNPVFSSD